MTPDCGRTGGTGTAAAAGGIESEGSEKRLVSQKGFIIPPV